MWCFTEKKVLYKDVGHKIQILASSYLCSSEDVDINGFLFNFGFGLRCYGSEPTAQNLQAQYGVSYGGHHFSATQPSSLFTADFGGYRCIWKFDVHPSMAVEYKINPHILPVSCTQNGFCEVNGGGCVYGTQFHISRPSDLQIKLLKLFTFVFGRSDKVISVLENQVVSSYMLPTSGSGVKYIFGVYSAWYEVAANSAMLTPFVTDARILPSWWATVRFNKPMLVVDFVRFVANKYGLFPETFLAYRVNVDRDFTLYTEKQVLKFFPRLSSTEPSHYWDITKLEEPFRALEVRVHMKPDNAAHGPSMNFKTEHLFIEKQGIGNILNSAQCHRQNVVRIEKQGFFDLYATQCFTHSGSSGASIRIISYKSFLKSKEFHFSSLDVTEVAIAFDDLQLVTAFQFNQKKLIDAFCIQYSVDRKTFRYYSDQPSSTEKTIFVPSDATVYVNPFYAMEIKFSCFSFKNKPLKYRINIHIKGQDKMLAEHQWLFKYFGIEHGLFYMRDVHGGMDFTTNLQYQPNNQYTWIRKNYPEERLRTQIIGDSCYTRPDKCDQGFTVAIRGLSIPNKYFDETRLLVTNFISFTSTSVNDPPKLDIETCLLLRFETFFKGFMNVHKARLNLAGFEDLTNLTATRNYHIFVFQSSRTTLDLKADIQQYMTGSSNSDVFAVLSQHFSYVTVSLKQSDNFDINLDIPMKEIVHKRFGYVFRVYCLFLDATTQTTNNLALIGENPYLTSLTLVTSVKVPPRIEYLHHFQDSSDPSKTIFVFPTPKVLAGFKLKTHQKEFVGQHKVKIFCIANEAFFASGNDDVLADHPSFEDGPTLHFRYLGDEAYYELPFPMLLIAFSIKINEVFVKDQAVIQFYGSNEWSEEIYPVVSSGLQGNAFENMGLGFNIFFDENLSLNAVIQTKNWTYSVTTPIKKNSDIAVVWNKTCLTLYGNSIPILTDFGRPITNVTDAVPFPEQEYLLVFGQYIFGFSYGAPMQLKKLQLWKRPLNDDEVSRISKVAGMYMYPDIVPGKFDEVLFPASYYPTLMLYGSNCNCGKVQCPCETEDQLLTARFKSQHITVMNPSSSESYVVNQPQIPSWYVVVEFPNINLNLTHIDIQHVYLYFTLQNSLNSSVKCLYFRLTDDTVADALFFESTGEEVEWCQQWQPGVPYQSPNLVDVFKSVYNNQQSQLRNITKLIIHNNKDSPLKNYVSPVQASPEEDPSWQLILKTIATIEFGYKPPTHEIYAYMPWNRFELNKYFKLDGEKSNKCLSVSVKVIGKGFAWLSILDGWKQVFKIYLSNKTKSTWHEIEVPLTERITRVMVIRNKYEDGYLLFKNMQYRQEENCIMKYVNEMVYATNYTDLKSLLLQVNYPIPSLLIPNDGQAPTDVISVFQTDNVVDTNYFANVAYNSVNRYAHYINFNKRMDFYVAVAVKEVVSLRDFTIAFWLLVNGVLELNDKFLAVNLTQNIFLNIDYYRNFVYGNISNPNVISTPIIGSRHNFIVIQHKYQKNETTICVNDNTCSTVNDLYVPETSGELVVKATKQVLCFQMYQQLIDISMISRLCPNRHSPAACSKMEKPCGICNQFTGQWDIPLHRRQFIDNDCQHVYDRYDVESHYAMDLAEKQKIFDRLDTTGGGINFEENNMSFQKGVANSALSLNNTSMSFKTPCTQTDCTLALWISFYELQNETIVFQLPTFYTVFSKTKNSTEWYLRFHWNECVKVVHIKVGLWQYLSVSSSGSDLTISIDGTDAIIHQNCIDAPTRSEHLSSMFILNAMNNVISIDELFMSSKVKSNEDMKSFYLSFVAAWNFTMDEAVHNMKSYIFDVSNLLCKHSTVAFTPGDYYYNQASKKTLAELHRLFENVEELMYIQDRFDYFFTDSLTGRFAFYFSNMNESVWKNVISAFSAPSHIVSLDVEKVSQTCHYIPHASRVYCAPNIEDCDLAGCCFDSNAKFCYKDLDLKYVSYTVVAVEQDSVILSVTLDETALELLYLTPLVSLKVSVYPVATLDKSLDTILVKPYNMKEILVKGLSVFTEYRVCILPVPMYGTSKNCALMDKTFTTEQGVPIKAPNIVNFETEKSLDDSASIVCTFSTLKEKSWLGVPHSFQIFWMETFNTTQLDPTEIQTWDLSRFNSISVDYQADDLEYSVNLNTTYLYESYTIIIRANTQKGSGYGIRGINTTNSYPASPKGIPLITNTSLYYDEVGNLYLHTSWTKLSNNTSIWQMDDVSEGFYLQTTSLLHFSMENVTKTLLQGPDTHVTSESDLVLGTPLYGYTTMDIYETNIAAGSPYGEGIWSNGSCFVLQIEEPTPQLFSLPPTNINATSIILHFTSTFPMSWKGKAKYVEFELLHESKSIEFSLYNVTLDIDIDHNLDKLESCDYEFIASYLQQNITRDVPLNNLNPFTEYNIVVIPCNEIGCNYNLPLYDSFTTEESVPSCAPKQLIAYNTSSTSLFLSWEPLPIECIHGNLITYVVNVSNSKERDSPTSQILVWHNISIELFDFNEFSKYCITVAGATRVGVGIYTNETCIYTDYGVPPLLPTVFNFSVTTSSINISVLPVNDVRMYIDAIIFTYTQVDPYTTSAVTHEKEFKVNHKDFFQDETLHNFTLLDRLQLYTLYEVNVTYLNKKGAGLSTIILIRTAEGVPNSSPANITVSDIQSTSVFASWPDLPKENWQGRRHQYSLHVKQFLPDGSIKVTVPNLKHNFTSYNISDLQPDTNITVSVSACTRVLCGPHTNVNFKTLEDVPIGYPTNVSLINKTSTSLSFTFVDIPIMQQHGIILNYLVNLSTIESGNPDDEHFTRFDDMTLNEYKVDFTGLKKFTVYSLNITSVNRVGFGPTYSALYQTSEDVPSMAPMNLTASGGAAGTIIFKWNQIPKEHRNGILLGYKITYYEVYPNNTSGETLSFTSTTYKVVLNVLNRDGQYNISIVAFTGVGEGPRSKIVTAEPGHFVDGNWTAWALWNFCSVSCGGGHQQRKRTCTNPLPVNGGQNCTGSDMEERECNLHHCSGYSFSPAGNFDCRSYCNGKDLLCSEFTETKNKTKIFEQNGVNCSTDTSESFWSEPYHPGFYQNTKKCAGYVGTPLSVACAAIFHGRVDKTFRRLCNCLNQEDVGFTNWASWGACSATCGDSIRSRRRICVSYCTGPDVHSIPCDVPHCPIDGQWGNWTEFSECNQTCGYGYRSRVRYCDSPEVQHGGEKCHGPAKHILPGCNPEHCPVNGGVTEWSQWTFCESPCGISNSTRSRYCENPAPAYRGKFCSEQLREDKSCNLPPCSPLEMTYTFRFTEEEWDYLMVYKAQEVTQNITQKIISNVYDAYSDISFISDIVVDQLSRGSVIADVTVTYYYVNRDQVVRFLDGLDRTNKLLSMPISSVNTNSTSITCSPPIDVDAMPYDKRTSNISFTPQPCYYGMNSSTIYVYYRIDNNGDGDDKDSTDVLHTDWIVTGMLSNHSWILVTDLQPDTRYKGFIMQANSLGNGPPGKAFYFQTPAAPPVSPPLNMTIFSPSPTSIFIEWLPIPLQLRNGRLSEYKLMCKEYFGSPKYKMVQPQYTSSTIGGLKAFTLYNIEISGVNAAGEGPVEYAIIKTLEGVPSVPPPDVVVFELQAIDWWSVSWGPIPDDQINGILLGYQLSYYLSYRSGIEVGVGSQLVIKEFDIFTFYYKAENLLHYATYDITIAGFTAAGNGPSPNLSAQTCRCSEHLYANWVNYAPYSVLVDDTNLAGIIPTVMKDILINTCGSCAKYEKSKLHFFFSKTGENPQKTSEFLLKQEISDTVDISFPIYGRVSGQVIAPDSHFLTLIPSPGCAIIVRDEAKLAGAVEDVIFGVLKVWPVLIVSYLIAAVFGFIVWFADQFDNPEEFTIGNVLKGPLVGFWFSFVTMTTLGYGDLAPRSHIGKSISMLWFLVGLILNGIIIGFITTALTSIGLPKEVKLYDTKVAALNNSFEYRYAVLRNARMGNEIQYNTVLSMLEALEKNVVDAVLIDTFTMASYDEILNQKLQKVKALVNTQSGYGFVLSGMSTVLKKDVESSISIYDEQINDFIDKLKEKVPDLSLPVQGAATKQVFSKESDAFESSWKFILIAIGSAAVLGVFQMIFMKVRSRQKIKPKSKEMCEDSQEKGVI